ncbi:MAG: hypothetical protein H0Z24_03185 [Thermosipho sp. (in: Bacteria)]|nr:hypothetical protein [Thermosipho sp. (in: thermotogales)]
MNLRKVYGDELGEFLEDCIISIMSAVEEGRQKRWEALPLDKRNKILDLLKDIPADPEKFEKKYPEAIIADHGFFYGDGYYSLYLTDTLTPTKQKNTASFVIAVRYKQYELKEKTACVKENKYWEIIYQEIY